MIERRRRFLRGDFLLDIATLLPGNHCSICAHILNSRQFCLMGDLALTNMALGENAAALILAERAIPMFPIDKEFNRNIESLATWIEGAIQRFRSGVKHSRVIELHNTCHYVFIVDEALVVREMRKFLLDE